MIRSLFFFPFLIISLWAQDGAPLHNVEIGGGDVFPLSGFEADNYSAGPALRPGYEIRPSKFFGAEVGWTQAWLPHEQCSRFGCEYPRETLKLLDYGLRGHLPITAGRVDLSLGVGGGYVWHQTDSFFGNSVLLQYSGKASVALNHSGSLRAAVTLRTWRDLGRPTQQWLSTTGSLIYGFGGHH